MSLAEQITDQEYKDGLALRRMRGDEDIWSALQRLLKRMDADLIDEWTRDETGNRSKKWLRGSREALRAVLPGIEEMVQNAEGVIEEKKDMEQTTRSHADDGVGSGDLAIA